MTRKGFSGTWLAKLIGQISSCGLHQHIVLAIIINLKHFYQTCEYMMYGVMFKADYDCESIQSAVFVSS